MSVTLTCMITFLIPIEVLLKGEQICFKISKFYDDFFSLSRFKMSTITSCYARLNTLINDPREKKIFLFFSDNENEKEKTTKRCERLRLKVFVVVLLEVKKLLLLDEEINVFRCLPR